MNDQTNPITLKRGLFRGLFSAEAKTVVRLDRTTTVSVWGERVLGECRYVCTVRYPVDRVPHGVDFISDGSPVAKALVGLAQALGDKEDPFSRFKHQFVPLYEEPSSQK